MWQEIFYYANEGNSISCEDTTSEAVSLQIISKNQEFAEALMGEGGPLQSGLAPDVGAATEAGDKKILEDILRDSVQKHVPKKKEEKNTEPAKPKTLVEIAEDNMMECLTKAGDSRKLSVSLGTLEYSGTLPEDLLKFSETMETTYRSIRALVKVNSTDPKAYKPLFDVVKERLQWFAQVEAGFSHTCWVLVVHCISFGQASAKGMLASIKPKKKAKAKKSSKTERAEEK